MNLTKSSNPVLGSKVFEKVNTGVYSDSGTMTINGTINKTFITFILMLASASVTWKMALQGEMASVVPFIILGAVGGLITAIIISFKPTAAPIATPIYAILEGLFLGAISAQFSYLYNGIVIQAVGLTFLTLFLMLFLYKTGVIKVTQKLRTGIITATGAIFVFYMLSFVLRLFGLNIPIFAGGLGIIVSLVIVGIAALNLVLDFDFIDRGAQSGAPKFMEWYGAFGLMVTLVWLYLEILRLLALIAGRAKPMENILPRRNDFGYDDC